MVKRKIFAFTDMNWSTGHVYFGLEKALPDYEFRYIHWRGWTMDVFKANFEWADICITSLFEERLMKSYLKIETGKPTIRMTITCGLYKIWIMLEVNVQQLLRVEIALGSQPGTQP